MDINEALAAMQGGATVTDEMFQGYRMLDEDEKIFFGDGEDIYRFRKSTGEFISVEEFLSINQKFKLEKDIK